MYKQCNLFYSTKPKETVNELVIPCRSKNNLLLDKVKNATGNTLDRLAAEEIINGMNTLNMITLVNGITY